MQWLEEKGKENLGGMVECASGFFHSLFQHPSASVWSCGNNHYGRFNHNTEIISPFRKSSWLVIDIS